MLRHADVAYVARHTDVFSAREGGIVVEDMGPELLAMMRSMLLAMDPPVHTAHRAPLSLHFRARVINGIEDRVREICRAIMAEARERGDVEFVHQVASPLPTRVIGELFGLPQQDWDHIHELAERNTSTQDPDITDASAEEATMEMALYAIELAANRREADRTDDLTSAILGADCGGEPMSDIEFGSFFVQLVTAGNDPAKGMLGSGLLTCCGTPTSWPNSARTPHSSPAPSRKSFATLTRCITSVAPQWPTSNCPEPGSPRATRWRCTTHRPTAMKTCSTIRRPSTSIDIRTRTCRSVSAATPARRPPGPAGGEGLLRGVARRIRDDRADGRAGADPLESEQDVQATAGTAFGLSGSPIAG